MDETDGGARFIPGLVKIVPGFLSMSFARFALLVGLVSLPAAAQVALPPLRPVIGDTIGGVPARLGQIGEAATRLEQSASALARDRVSRLTRLLRSNPATIDRDDRGEPARRGELLVLDPDPAILVETGFSLIERGEIDGVGVAFARLAVPRGMTLAKAERTLKSRFPNAVIAADHLHFEAGAVRASAGSAAQSPRTKGGTVAIIDGGVDPRIPVAQMRGFASGAPVANAHATAIAAILVKTGVERLVVADVYGRDPAGGNALAIARAIGWMTTLRVPVINISLVGPQNPLLARTIAAAGARGTIVVAAVGNDGPAAPAAYPASYADVIAVTGVDRRNRALIEAGRTLHLDYAAPGADIAATGLDGRPVKLRGTSFAAPFVAARIAAAYPHAANRTTLLQQIDATAIDLGKSGSDPVYGRGLICGECR